MHPRSHRSGSLARPLARPGFVVLPLLAALGAAAGAASLHATTKPHTPPPAAERAASPDAAPSDAATDAPAAQESGATESAAEHADDQDRAPASLTHPDPEVDRLLDRLEAADRGLLDLTATIVYARHDLALESLITRFGSLTYRTTPRDDAGERGRTVFAIRFDKIVDDLGRVSDHQQLWLFDGAWLVEQDFKSMTYIKRQVAREGVDPTRLGEGPLPIPIGQRKREILQRFEVAAAPPVEGLEPPDPEFGGDDVAQNFREAVQAQNAVQLRLTPRLHDPNGFDEIRLWYAQAPASDRLLPVLARAVKLDADGYESDVAYVQLVNAKTNVGVAAEDVQAPAPRQADGWHVEIRPLPEDDQGLDQPERDEPQSD